jgi:hypothetical protein
MVHVQYYILFENVIVKMNLFYFDIGDVAYYYDNVAKITFLTNLIVLVQRVLRIRVRLCHAAR